MKPHAIRVTLTTILLVVPALAMGPRVAWAAPEGRIQDLNTTPGEVTFVLSADGLAEGQSIDLASVRSTIDGVEAPTEARTFLGEASAAPGQGPQRTVLLVLDSSGSMGEDARLVKAKRAAKQYLESVPADVEVGLVAFADEAEVRVQPTTDRADVEKAIDQMKAQGATALNDAIVLAVDTLGEDGSRNAVLLSDGKDEGSSATASQATKALAKSGVILDAVSLGEGVQEKQLAAFAKAGNGTLVTATDARGLTEAFEEAARAVSSQLAVVVEVPGGIPAGTSELSVTAIVDDAPISDRAAVLIKPAAAPAETNQFGPIAVAQPEESIVDNTWFLVAVLAAVFLAIAAIAMIAIGFLDTKNRKEGRIARRLEEVSFAGIAPTVAAAQPATVLGTHSVVVKAVSFAERVAASRDATAIAHKLENANVALKPGEWVVVHGLIAVLAGLLATLMSGFDVLISVLAFAAGLVLPWTYLGYRTGKRRTKFYEALPEAMQMLAGSLRAGYSLPQAFDNVARESGGPLGEEITRALMESRLGLPIEDALEAVAQRMESRDFHWVVMAIRINRKVGGNLAEVLTNVGMTLRERERLRRQVKTLSAEGVLSGWILGCLPFVLLLYMLGARRPYIMPLFTEPLGWVMIAFGLTIYVIGIIWMRKLVKMEV